MPAKSTGKKIPSRKKSAGARSKKVCVVGAGRLGTAFARAMAACGYEIAAVVSRRASRAKRAAGLVSSDTLALTAAQLDRLPLPDIFLITTPDDLIAETASRIAESLPPASRDGRVALHASGVLASEALSPLRDCGFSAGSMHPLLSVSDSVEGAASLRRAFFCTEGDARAVSVARKIVRDLGGQNFSINTADKPLYHAAAVIACGHTVALFSLAAELLARCGLPEARAHRVLLPLLHSTLDNLASERPARALTGPFARGDVATVRKHIDALQRQGAAGPLAIYNLLGKQSLRLAESNGGNAAALRQITRLLEEAEAGEQNTAGKKTGKARAAS